MTKHLARRRRRGGYYKNTGQNAIMKTISIVIMMIMGSILLTSLRGIVSYDDTSDPFHQAYVILGLSTGGGSTGLIAVVAILSVFTVIWRHMNVGAFMRSL